MSTTGKRDTACIYLMLTKAKIYLFADIEDLENSQTAVVVNYE